MKCELYKDNSLYCWRVIDDDQRIIGACAALHILPKEAISDMVKATGRNIVFNPWLIPPMNEHLNSITFQSHRDWWAILSFQAYE